MFSATAVITDINVQLKWMKTRVSKKKKIIFLIIISEVIKQELLIHESDMPVNNYL